MDHLGVFFLSFFFLYLHIKALETQPPTKYMYTRPSTIHQSIVILIVIIAFLFLITIVLISYPRLRLLNRENRRNRRRNDLISTMSSTRVSGIKKSLINSLPSFTFSSLQGSKEGLECAVCLSKFKDAEVLRLLPKCKHAFHGTCVDKWLERNSNCPLCRQKVDIKDIKKLKLSPSFMFPHSHSEALVEMPTATCASDLLQSPQCQERQELDLSYSHSNIGVELFVQREEYDDKEDTSTAKETNKPRRHKFKHKIIVLGIVFNQRWSDVDSSDIISLNSDLINSTSSRLLSYTTDSERYLSTAVDKATFMTEDKRMKLKEEMKGRQLSDRSFSASDLSIPSTSDTKSKSDKSFTPVIPLQERSASEITTLSRFSDFSGGDNVEAERTRAWLAIAKQTVQSFGSKERSTQSQHSGKQSMV